MSTRRGRSRTPGSGRIIAPSFADIFRNNCAKVGVVAVVLAEPVVRQLFDLVAADPAVEVTIDLESLRVTADPVGDLPGVDVTFDFDAHARHMLLNGLDDIGLTMQDEADITAYESRREAWRPLVPTR